MKLTKLNFENHFIFKDNKFHFLHPNGNICNNIVIVGNNGSGKTFFLETIRDLQWLFNYGINNGNYEKKEKYKNSTISIEYSFENKLYKLTSYPKTDNLRNFPDNFNNQNDFSIFAKNNTSIYSSVGINYYSREKIKSVGNRQLDKEFGEFGGDKVKETPENLTDNIIQLLNSVATLDANDYQNWAREHPNDKNDINKIDKRIKRFTNSFKIIFDDELELNGFKDNVIPKFKKKNISEDIEIYNLSSGEKQIILRGAFLLADKEALRESLILIDEPEISMHPKWQKNIFNYYVNLFKDENNLQKSQIFMSTHSEYVLEAALKEKDTMIIILNPNFDPPKIIYSNSSSVPNNFILKTLTLGEIFYRVFNIYTIDFHQALFESFKNKHNITKYKDSNYKKFKIPQNWVPQNWNGSANFPKETFLPLYIRNHIDHPDGGRSSECIENKYLKESIDYMLKNY